MARAAIIPPISSPKRTSRSRARGKASTAEPDVAPTKKSRITKTKTPSVTPEARSRVGRRTGKKERTEVDEGTDDEIDAIETKQKGKAKVVEGRGKIYVNSTRAGSVAIVPANNDDDDDDDDELAQSEMPKRQAPILRSKSTSKKEVKLETRSAAPAKRTRPKTAKTPNRSIASEGREELDHKGVPKQIRIMTNSTAVRSNILRGPAKKKTVSFKDVSVSDAEEEKENRDPPRPASRGTGRCVTQDGMRAKPARKLGTTGTSRGCKPSAAKSVAPKPLSPKGTNQVTKSLSSYFSSDGEGDELISGKDQTKLVICSPIKAESEHKGLASPVRRVNFTPNKSKISNENIMPLQLTRPIDFSDSIFMSSPARRPAASPFQYTMRETPKRDGLALWDETKTLAEPSLTPIQHSLLKASPKKGSLGASSLQISQPDFQASSPLKISPKKGSLGALFCLSPEDTVAPFATRASLIQNRAKRIASPFKASITRDDVTAGDELIEGNTNNDHHSSVPSGENAEASPAQSEAYKGVETDTGLEGRYDTSATVSENGRICLSGDEINAAAEDNSVEMTVELNTRLEHIGEGAHQFNSGEHCVEGHVEELSHPDDESSNRLYGDMDNVVNEAEHGLYCTKYGTYDCAYLCEEAETNVKEREQQLDYCSEDRQLDDLDPKRPEPRVDQKEKLALTSDVGNSSHVMPRLSVPTNMEDVFIEKSESHDDADGSDLGIATEYLEEAEKSSSVKEYFHSDVGMDDQGAPKLLNEHELPQAGSEREWPCEVLTVSNSGDEYVLEERDDEQTYRHPIEEVDESAHMTLSSHNVVAEDSVAALPYEVDEVEEPITSSFTPPPAPTPPFNNNFRCHGMFRDTARYSITSNDATVPKLLDASSSESPTEETPFCGDYLEAESPLFRDSLGITPLAAQFSRWKADSPEKAQPGGRRRRGVFSFDGIKRSPYDIGPGEISYPDISKHLSRSTHLTSPRGALENDIGMSICEDSDNEAETPKEDVRQVIGTGRQPMSEITLSSEPSIIAVGRRNGLASQCIHISNPSDGPIPSTYSAYGSQDEAAQEENIPPKPYVQATPVTKEICLVRTIHTVSKVLLKPEGEISPLKVSRKRNRSLGNVSPVRSLIKAHKATGHLNSHDALSCSKREIPALRYSADGKGISAFLDDKGTRLRPEKNTDTTVASVNRAGSSPKAARARHQVLQGSVIFVDVYTAEGEDASGIFIDLLRQMGARCVKNWDWSPRSSISPVEGVDLTEEKIGITHVVFKDGGIRTLEKVRQASGLVKCVGVNWVLDCEREDRWMDEILYTVDGMIVTRSDAKRRRNMRPRALSNINGTPVKTGQPAVSENSKRSLIKSQDSEYLNRLSPPVPCYPSTPENLEKSAGSYRGHCKTPGTSRPILNPDSAGMSPLTPFFLQKAKLVQQTCPPKQTYRGLFSTSLSVDEELSSQRLKSKLEAARRKSHAYKF